MSHQVKQIGAVAITSIELLGRACAATEVPEVKAMLKLDMNQKEARYWGGALDKCDGTITFSRELSPADKSKVYEIALRRDKVQDARGQMVDGYTLWADTHGVDRGIEDRIGRVFQNYRIEEIKQVAQNDGAVSVHAIEGRPGWQEVVVEMP